ncbi:MAG: ABC transporter ATP-binding protein [Synechococcus sp.]
MRKNITRTADSAKNEHKQAILEARGVGLCYNLKTAKAFKNRRKAAKIKDLRFEDNLFWALRDINLDFYSGQTIGIIGPNGAGKSTLCSVLAGIIPPDEGIVKSRGDVGALLSIGAGGSGWLTGRQNIMTTSILFGLSREEIKERIDEIIEFSGLGEHIDQPVRTYSSGMKSRLTFSVATCIEREILFLDEVLSVGDKSFKKKAQKRMTAMMSSSKLVVVVSHSLSFVRETTTHCLWLNKGRVKRFGKPDDVVAAYEEFEERKQEKKQKRKAKRNPQTNEVQQSSY